MAETDFRLLQVKVPADLARHVKMLAAEHEMTLSAIVEHALKTMKLPTRTRPA